MKKILFLVLLLFSCNKSNINWSDIAFEDISTIRNDKNIMLIDVISYIKATILIVFYEYIRFISL